MAAASAPKRFLSVDENVRPLKRRVNYVYDPVKDELPWCCYNRLTHECVQRRRVATEVQRQFGCDPQYASDKKTCEANCRYPPEMLEKVQSYLLDIKDNKTEDTDNLRLTTIDYSPELKNVNDAVEEIFDNLKTDPSSVRQSVSNLKSEIMKYSSKYSDINREIDDFKFSMTKIATESEQSFDSRVHARMQQLKMIIAKYIPGFERVSRAETQLGIMRELVREREINKNDKFSAVTKAKLGKLYNLIKADPTGYALQSLLIDFLRWYLDVHYTNDLGIIRSCINLIISPANRSAPLLFTKETQRELWALIVPGFDSVNFRLEDLNDENIKKFAEADKTGNILLRGSVYLLRRLDLIQVLKREPREKWNRDSYKEWIELLNVPQHFSLEPVEYKDIASFNVTFNSIDVQLRYVEIIALEMMKELPLEAAIAYNSLTLQDRFKDQNLWPVSSTTKMVINRIKDVGEKQLYLSQVKSLTEEDLKVPVVDLNANRAVPNPPFSDVQKYLAYKRRLDVESMFKDPFFIQLGMTKDSKSVPAASVAPTPGSAYSATTNRPVVPASLVARAIAGPANLLSNLLASSRNQAERDIDYKQGGSQRGDQIKKRFSPKIK